ncbi:hypothetical protein D3C72_523440 [compost metagenome]
MDVITIERRDEGFMQRIQRCMGYLVCLLFDAFNGVYADFQVVEIGHQRDHFTCTLDAEFGVLIEEVEKFTFFRQKSSKHDYSL